MVLPPALQSSVVVNQNIAVLRKMPLCQSKTVHTTKPVLHGSAFHRHPQMELQDDGVMLGLDSSLGKDIVGIINNVFQAPWGGSHTCQKDEKALECSLCQSSILCYQLGCELLERLTPREEIRLVVRDKYLCDKHTSSLPSWAKQVQVWGREKHWSQRVLCQ